MFRPKHAPAYPVNNSVYAYEPPPAYDGNPYPIPPREAVTTTGMSVAEGAVHVFLIVMSCGLWYPVYRARKHGADRHSRTKYRGYRQ